MCVRTGRLLRTHHRLHRQPAARPRHGCLQGAVLVLLPPAALVSPLLLWCISRTSNAPAAASSDMPMARRASPESCHRSASCIVLSHLAQKHHALQGMTARQLAPTMNAFNALIAAMGRAYRLGDAADLVWLQIPVLLDCHTIVLQGHYFLLIHSLLIGGPHIGCGSAIWQPRISKDKQHARLHVARTQPPQCCCDAPGLLSSSLQRHRPQGTVLAGRVMCPSQLRDPIGGGSPGQGAAVGGPQAVRLHLCCAAVGLPAVRGVRACLRHLPVRRMFFRHCHSTTC